MFAAISPDSAEWMVRFAFWASLILTLLKISDALMRAARSPKLHVKLTPEAFFRLTDWGETLFCNGVLLAWNGPVLIVDARAVLQKTNAPTKSFPFKILEFGEKVKGSGAVADHYFHSRSAIAYIAESKPQQSVYLCVQEMYEDRSRRAIAEFRQAVLNYKQEVLARAGTSNEEDRARLQQVMLVRVNEIVEGSVTRIMEIVQLEPGEYNLILQVDYTNPKNRVFRKTKTVTSSIGFTVGQEVRDFLRVNLRQSLLVVATNLLLDQTVPFNYPEYNPVNIRVK
jgi:hypothetical protein